MNRFDPADGGWFRLTADGPMFHIRAKLGLADFDGDASAFTGYFIAREQELQAFDDARRARNTRAWCEGFKAGLGQ
jgi:hypothetical protein